MTALPVQNGTDDRPASTAPKPLQRLFRQAGLGPPPASMRELRFDTDWDSRGQRKIIMAFTIDRADAARLMGSSPALRGAMPSHPVNRSDAVLAVLGKGPGESGAQTGARIPEEPAFPWWRPGPSGTARRFAYRTIGFDFVEVIIDEREGRVHVRAIT